MAVVKPRMGRPSGKAKGRGFTLIELLVVITVIALASAGAILAMRDSSQTQIEKEAQRLAALLNAAHAQSVATGVPVVWEFVPGMANTPAAMRWMGLVSQEPLPLTWLSPSVQSDVRRLVLGPEPILTPTRLRLSIPAGTSVQTRFVISDGLDAFRVVQ